MRDSEKIATLEGEVAALQGQHERLKVACESLYLFDWEWAHWMKAGTGLEDFNKSTGWQLWRDLRDAMGRPENGPRWTVQQQHDEMVIVSSRR